MLLRCFRPLRDWRSLVVAGCILIALVALPSLLFASGSEPEAEVGPPKIYVLSFNRWGDLSNPAERELAKRELAAHRNIERIIIFSYGWANDGESSYATYHELVDQLAANAPEGAVRKHTAVIAVGWDSAQSGFRKLFNDVLPFPALATGLSFIPDNLLFPISFWSKAAMADRIGFGGLRTTLNTIFEYAYPDGEGTPDIFLIGHSFGTRIVSELMQDKVAVFPVNAVPFVARDHVRGAMLLQPAMAQAGLHRDAEYPVLVTQSEHDHAVGGLFPMANLLVNTTTFTSFEALFRYHFFDPVDRTVSSAARTVGSVTHTLPQDEEGSDEERGKKGVTGTVVRKAARFTGRSWYIGLRTVGEIVSVPVALLSGAVTTPINYIYVQAHGLIKRPFHHFMDTLAQLPGTEAFVYGASKAFDREVPWGQRGKGFLNLGALNESVGRLVTPALVDDIPREVYTLDDIESLPPEARCGLPRCKGIVVVDATDFIEVGGFGLSLNRPGVDFTLGWLDPLGSHTDYKNKTVVHLMAEFFEAADTE